MCLFCIDAGMCCAHMWEIDRCRRLCSDRSILNQVNIFAMHHAYQNNYVRTESGMWLYPKYDVNSARKGTNEWGESYK